VDVVHRRPKGAATRHASTRLLGDRRGHSHGDIHVAAAVDQLGRLLAITTVPTTTRGYRQLLTWSRKLGQVERFGVEGTGAFATGLLRFLHAHGQLVLEVDRPDRSTRRRRGKSDPIDAEAAARAVLAGAAVGTPKARDGTVEMVRALRVARRSAVKAAPRRPTSSTTWSSPPRSRSALSCAA
jgi:transposase